ncbi:MAG: c-type cytochrome [Gallionella sp.]
MKSILISIVSTASLVIAASALAVDMPPEGKAKCGACHAVDKKIIGPSFMDVSAKYKGDKDAASKIAASIAKGGSFGWKLGTMPAKGMGASEAQIKSMSEFIAGLSK